MAGARGPTPRCQDNKGRGTKPTSVAMASFLTNFRQKQSSFSSFVRLDRARIFSSGAGTGLVIILRHEPSEV